jgi:hypothetical protein
MAKKPSALPKIPSPNLFSSKTMLAIVGALVILATLIYFRQGGETTITGRTTTIPPMPTLPTTQLTTTTTVSEETATTTTTAASTTNTGRLVIALKDEEQNIPGGAVAHQMNFTIEGVEVMRDENDEWIELSSGAKTLDIMQYTDTVAIVADAVVEWGVYEKVKLLMSGGDIWITSDIFYIFTPKRYGLVVPEQTTVNHEFNVFADQTLTLILDFDVPASVLRIGADYRLDPVITVTEESGVPENAVAI